MKFSILFVSLASAIYSANCFSDEFKGLYIGGGFFGASASDCEYSGCNYSGEYLEVGYDINKIVSVELKYGSGESSYNYGDADLKIDFFGINAGGGFGLSWFKLYGKAGLGRISESESLQYASYKETAPTAGIGAQFQISGEQRGLYVKLEAFAVRFQDDTTGAAYAAGLGYRF